MLTLTSVLHRTVRLYGNRTAMIEPEAQYSWIDFADRVARAASVLQSLGVKRGSRYGIIARNSVHHAELICAGYWMGALPVPVNYRLAPVEIAYVLDKAQCRLLVVEDIFTEIMDSDDLAPWFDAVLLLTKHKAKSEWPQYETLLKTAELATACDCNEFDDALILYTGGTTGRPKGVRLSHRNIVSNALQVGFEYPARSDDVYLHVAPMFHSADLLATAFTIAGGAHAFLPKFTGQALLEAIQTYRVTSTMLTPTMAIQAVREPDFDRMDLSSLRQLLYGSSPMAVDWIQQLLERLPGVEIVQGYGLTETAPILTLLHMAEHKKALSTGEYDILKSAGRPVPGVDMKIIDPDGSEVPTGQSGEVTVRAPNVSTGYLNRPEATEAAFQDGWFLTGDIGRLDEHGYLYLLDRKKDMIITGGENVFSLEVEIVLHQHPKVHECAVIGVPDETWGEALLAIVVPKSGETLTNEEMITHCRDKIGGYKIPRRYIFLEALPKSAMDKVLKTELRKRYGGAAQG